MYFSFQRTTQFFFFLCQFVSGFVEIKGGDPGQTRSPAPTGAVETAPGAPLRMTAAPQNQDSRAITANTHQRRSLQTVNFISPLPWKSVWTAAATAPAEEVPPELLPRVCPPDPGNTSDSLYAPEQKWLQKRVAVGANAAARVSRSVKSSKTQGRADLGGRRLT